MLQEKTTSADKGILSAFLLDEAKLSRMVGIIEQSLADDGMPFTTNYGVTLANGKELDLAKLDEVFALDNTLRNPITRLSLSVLSIALLPGNDKKPYEKTQCSIVYYADRRPRVSLKVVSTDSKQVNRIFPEIEQQIERTLISNWIYKYVKPLSLLTLLFYILSVLVVILVLRTPQTRRLGNVNLSSSEITHLKDMAALAETRDDKIDFIFDLYVTQLSHIRSNNTAIDFSVIWNINTLVVVIACLLALGCFIYLVAYCYPMGVFLWGDYAEYHAQMLARRKTLWNLLVFALVFGVFVNLVSSSVGRFLGV